MNEMTSLGILPPTMDGARLAANCLDPARAAQADLAETQNSVDDAASATIMIVDDEPINIKVVQKHLRSSGYGRFVSTSDSRQALELIQLEQPDIILLDIMMPHVNGLEILESVRGDRRLQHLPVLILTAASDAEVRFRALDLGATDFLSKPVQPAELVPRIRNALIVKAHQDHLANYSSQLERKVRMRTAELAQSREEVIRVLACAAEFRDQETGNHVLRVGRYASVIARQLGCDLARAELIGQAAILHDVGKIGIPDGILLKPEKLSKEEFDTMKNHCEFGWSILRGTPRHASVPYKGPSGSMRLSDSPVLKMAASIAMSHHERWDGTGYPVGLSGESIPIEGRITAVADVFDALSSRRPYKERMPLDKCFEMLENGRETHFDPQVLDAFFARTDDIVRIALDLADE